MVNGISDVHLEPARVGVHATAKMTFVIRRAPRSSRPIVRERMSAVDARNEIRATVAGLTDVGFERDHNEDAFVVARVQTGEVIDVKDGCAIDVAAYPVLLAVADGMGGESAGEIASALTIEILRVELAKSFVRTDPRRALRVAVQRTHARVTAAATGPHTGMGSTLVAIVVDGARCVIASVGDSRVYLLRSGALHQLTEDQSMFQRLVDQGQLVTEEEIAASPYKSVIWQAIGCAPTETLELPLVDVELVRGDVLLLCSDGLTNALVDDGIARVLERTALPRDACARLVDAANACGGHDTSRSSSRR